MGQVTSAFTAGPELLAILQAKCAPIRTAANELLFRQGDPPRGIYLILRGAAILTMHSGTRIVMQVKTVTGAILGLPGAIGGSPYSLTAEIDGAAEVGFISREQLAVLMQTDSSVALKLLQVLAAEVTAARQALSAALQ